MVRSERDGDVAVFVIDNPPINAASAGVRRGLVDAIAALTADATLTAAVIIGEGKTFIAGADLREFGQPLQEPLLPAVIRAIERCAKPIVAALHGAALGGGLELALGCDARVASPGTLVGLPEVTLGIIPGAGGTQRLPRLVGIARAIELICSGERVSSEQALAWHLVDALADGDLRAAAVAHARGMGGRKARLRDRPVAHEDAAAVERAASAALRAGRNRPAVHAAIAAVKTAATLPIDLALTAERAAFEQLRGSREALALRHQFFAEREAAKLPDLAGARPRVVQSIAVIGAGTMGSGIAIAALDAGFDVLLLEQDDAALARGRERIRAHYAGRVGAGKLDGAEAAAREARLVASTAWEPVGHVDLVIEAVFEDLAVKQDVFRRLDALVRPGTILASNTSYLDIDAMAGATTRPYDVLGLHFFSPANVMRLVEVIRARATSADALATGIAVAKRMRKLPVVARNAFGFIGNRIFADYRRQCEFMLEEGAYPEQVDAALESFGFAMGPFAVADLAGLDIAWRVRKSMAAQRDPAARYVDIADRLCAEGRFGRKTGAGFYRYADGRKEAAPDAHVRTLIDAASARKNIVRRTFTAGEIERRALLAMVNAAALLLGEGVAEHTTDVDVVLVNGYGFPRWEGGAVFWARQRGQAPLAQDLDWLAQVSGPGFVRGDLRPLFANT
ncbi:MAG: 3-hydroxyacyl-CoA dehydrogenase NAD-binding domain-containing protein [Casimicrobiaceae bacterium]